MDNAEEIMHFLEVFTKRKSKSIPPELNDYLSYVARTGDPVFQWGLVKRLFKEKLLCVLSDFYENSPGIEIPPYPNVDPFNYDSMKNSLLERLDTFLSAPFTLQRICELLIDPRKQYNRIDKFMRAIEKNILVVSTREPGSRCIEQDNGEPADAPHNGSDNNSDYNVDVEMEEVTWKESRFNKYRAHTSSSDHRKSDDDDIDDDKKSPDESPEDQVAEYESVTPPDDSANDDNDTQESDSAEEDKADDSSNSSDELMPKTPEGEVPKDEEENPIVIPKIVIHEDMTDEKEITKGVSEIVSADNKPNDEITNNEATQIPNDDVKPDNAPIETDDVSPSNEKVDDRDIEDVSQKNEDASSPEDDKVTHKVHEANENVDEAIVEKCDIQAESIPDPQLETKNKTENDAAIKIIEKVPDEPNSTVCNIEDNEASPKSPSITNLGVDSPKMESADSAITALAKDDKDMVKVDQHVAEAEQNIAEDKQALVEDDKIITKDDQQLEKAAKTSELTPDSST